MTVMGFSHDPGPLPFVTIRDAKWANRLVALPVIRVTGEHGCKMPRGVAKVVSVDPYTEDCPPHLVDKYDGRPLVSVLLDAPARCTASHCFDAEWGMCARCGVKL
jgi:hypothetical protein